MSSAGACCSSNRPSTRASASSWLRRSRRARSSRCAVPRRGARERSPRRVLERGRFDLLYDFAQPYSITLICRLLGVPTDRHRDLLDWSHRHVKMYEFDTTEAQAESATQAAREFRDYVLGLIDERRGSPRDDLVSGLVAARVDGGQLSDDEIVSTVVVLLNAGHEATVNTLGNGVTALLHHPDEWRRLVEGEVGAAAIEELIRWDPPLQLFERWVLEDGVEIAGVPFRAARCLDALRLGEPRPARVRRPRPARPWAANAADTSASAAASTSASARRSRGSSSRRACGRSSSGRLLSSSSSEPERVPAFVIRGYQAVEVVT